jgi:acetate kinase
MNILALNAGSNSLKFEIVAVQPNNRAAGEESVFGRTMTTGAYDNIGKEDATFTLFQGKSIRQQKQIEIQDHGQATELLFDWIDQGGAREAGIDGLAHIERIGHRVVHGADLFDASVRITDAVLHQIEGLEDLAPLHNASALRVIRAAQGRVDSSVPMIAVFDTVFHRTIPEEAALYPLPLELAKRHKIRRYGFHGISHRYLMLRYAQITHRPVTDMNLITLHLEGGSSAAAIRQGKSIDTSMGFTPLEGLMMSTRCGDIDPALVTSLMRKENLNSEEVEKLLNKRCGLLGVSGISADTRELAKHLDDQRADLAINIFCYRVRKYIGAYLAALDGAEAIIFGGGIGENTPVVRERILQNLEWFGVTLDHERNGKLIDREGSITTPGSRIQAWVIPTAETLMVAQEAASCE